MMSQIYKGRLSFMDIYNLPAGTFLILYNLAIERMNSEEGKKQLEAEAVEDTLQEVM